MSSVLIASLTSSSTMDLDNFGVASFATTRIAPSISCRFEINHMPHPEFYNLLSSSIHHLKESEPVIEGQLKEKKGGKWKIFKKWKSRYFTLSGAKLTYQETVSCERIFLYLAVLGLSFPLTAF